MKLKEQIVMACKIYKYNDVLAQMNNPGKKLEYYPGMATTKEKIDKARKHE